jgi:hypothetical protein
MPLSDQVVSRRVEKQIIERLVVLEHMAAIASLPIQWLPQ